MKSNLVILFSVGVLAASGYSQNSGGTAGGTTAPGTPTGPTTPGAAGTPPPALNPVTAETNQFVATNLPPTSQPGFTNRILATNSSLLMRDQALSEGDRRLLTQIRISVYGTSDVTATSGGGAASGGTSVHFILRDGAVRLVGVVPNAEEQNRIVTTVQKVPGVVRVYDALQVSASASPGQTPAPGQTPGSGQTPAPSQPAASQTPVPGQPQ